MIITQLDTPITAEEARQVSLANKDDSEDRYNFRDLMQNIRYQASFGYTRYTTALNPKPRSRIPSKNVQDALRSMGYKVIEKRAMEWDDEKKGFSDEKPKLDHAKRETFFLEITWG